MGSDPHEALVGRCAAGDVAALAALYDAFGAAAFGLARRMTGNAGRAEAAVEAAFADVWREAGAFDPARERVSAWMLARVHRRALDAVRGAPRPGPGSGAEPAAGAAAGDEREAARTALARLEPEERRVLELAYLDGYTMAELATLLGEPAEAVRLRLQTALANLRGLLVGAHA
jgi:RNA polymerase sigma-70 factor (ECF subfamily)